MTVTGIICEYNPLHLGHKKQLDHVRQKNPDGGIVCLMSGNYVQRGMPAIIDKMHRAEAAVRCGADLVLELPATYALRSAEGFAAGGVSILSPFCNKLCFGAEIADPDSIMQIAEALLSKDFSETLRKHLDTGLSFPAARQVALEETGLDASVLTQPNNILAVEYCKAILSQGSSMVPMLIKREGDYHDDTPDPRNPSATALRKLMGTGDNWQRYVPQEATTCTGAMHHIAIGERAILARLRTMTDEDFTALPYGSEGLWRKLMHAARTKATLEEILEATKSKRYTRTRLDRMVMCAFLGITEELLRAPVPYVRVLAFNDKGRQILKKARAHGEFINIGEASDYPYQQFEDRCSDLYGLFTETPEAPGSQRNYRVYYHKNGEV